MICYVCVCVRMLELIANLPVRMNVAFSYQNSQVVLERRIWRFMGFQVAGIKSP